MTVDAVKPLLRNGFQYLAEFVKCSAAGLLMNFVVFVGLLKALPPSRGVGFMVAAVFVVFTVLYGVAGHQRGLFRVLSNLAHAHGGLLFDQTIGRFIQWTEARRPGSVAGLLSAPGKLAAAFKDYLAQDGSAIPRPLRRLGIRYVDRLGRNLVDSASVPSGAVVDGQLREDALKAWAVQRMREQFEPAWTFFLLVAGAHILLAVALWWPNR